MKPRQRGQPPCPEYETSIYIYENEGQERKLLSRENFLQKKSFVHRVKIFEEKKKQVSNDPIISIVPPYSSLLYFFLFYIQWMNYRKEESNIREPSTTGSLNLNEDIANIKFTIYIQLYSKERWNISSTYLERQQ